MGLTPVSNYSRRVLVTGAAGALGSALPPAFLVDPGTFVWVLLRPHGGRSVADRWEGLKLFWRSGGLPAETLTRARVLAGDAAQDRLGLSMTDHDVVRQSVTHVIHAAGKAEVGLESQEARDTCLETTRRVIAFCQGAPGFQKMEHLSTVGVAGHGKGTLPEERLSLPRDFQTPYEAAKAEAEDLVWSAVDAGLPITVHRPTFVVGAARDGRILRFQVFYDIMDFLSGRATRGWTTRFPPAFLDAVPVDFVARCVALSAARPDWAGRVFHLVSRTGGAWSARDYADRLPGLFRALGGAVPRPHVLPWGLFRRLVPWLGWMAPDRMRPLLREVGKFLKELDSSDQRGVVVDNAETTRALGSAGVSLPAVDEWIRPVLAGYLSALRGDARD